MAIVRAIYNKRNAHRKTCPSAKENASEENHMEMSNFEKHRMTHEIEEQ